jgi:hypothetical protein
MPDDGPGSKKKPDGDKGIIGRVGYVMSNMPNYKRMVRKQFVAPEKVILPFVFGSLILGIFIVPVQLKKQFSETKNDDLASEQIQMELSDDTKEQVQYAIDDSSPPPPAASSGGGGGPNQVSNSGSSDPSDPGQTITLGGGDGLSRARQLATHGWNRVAMALYQQHIRKNPKAFDVRMELIRYLMTSKQGKEAKTECIAALNAGPSIDESAAISLLFKQAQLINEK